MSKNRFGYALAVILILAVLYFVYPEIRSPSLEELPGGKEATSTAGVQPTAHGTEDPTSDFWDVYFTDPEIPFDGVITGGLDENLVQLIRSAKISIDLALYELNLESVITALTQASEQGVEVRLVYDSEEVESSVISRLKDSGISTVPDKRSALMHNKFVVIDGSLVWTGATNLTVNGVYKNNNNAIVIWSDELAQNYELEFEEMFSGAFGPSSPQNTDQFVSVQGIKIESYFAPEDEVIEALVALVSSAEISVHFLSFSFTEDSLGEAMLSEMNTGVVVAGLFEKTGASGQYSEYQRLLAACADVRLDVNPSFMHNKVIVVDGKTVAVGSFNFSQNASESNDENLLIIHNEEIASLFEQEFAKLMAGAEFSLPDNCSSN